MKTRLIVAAVLLPMLMCVVLIFPPIWTAGVVAIMGVVAAWELLHTTKLVENKRLIFYAMAMAIAVVVWRYFQLPLVWGLALLWLFFMVLILEMLGNHGKLGFEKISLTMVSGVVIPLCFTTLLGIRMTEYGKYYIVIALFLAFTADSGAYFAGRLFGKHKLAPIISPKKTVEGAIGGVLTTMLFMCLYGLVVEQFFGMQFHYGFALIYGFLGALTSIVGDLAFSVIKRQSGIKDYGKLMPGHGGVLDRFDSMVVVAPLTELLMIFIPVIWK